MITVRQNDTILKIRNKRRSKINKKHWIIRVVDNYNIVYYIVICIDIYYLRNTDYYSYLKKYADMFTILTNR